MKSHEHLVFRFGEFTLVPGERRLLRNGEPVALTGKAFDMLTVLAENAGHLVGKDALMERVWPGVVVEEVNLSVNVSAVRKALGRSADDDGWIETVPRKGYRLNVPVEVSDAATIAAAPKSRPRSTGPLSRRAAVVGLVAVLAAGAYAWRAGQGGGNAYASVAVLPLTADAPGNEYLAQGVSDAAINSMAGIPGLRVMPRASAFRFKGTADPVRAGRDLGVAAVVAGSVAQDAAGVRLQLELIDVARGSQVWGAAYQGKPDELARLQGRAHADLLGALRASPAQGVAAGRPPATRNAEAYRAYLQGRFQWSQRSEKALQMAVAHFKRAIELDPEFAPAHAGLADALTTLGYLGWMAPINTFPAARPHALRALELDPSLADAHASLGYIKLYFDWDWRGAGEEFQRAITLDPRNPVSHQWYATYLLAAGRPDEAFREIQVAQGLDPLSLAINTDIGFHHYYSGRYEDAIRQLRAVQGMKPDFALAHLWLGRTYVELGRHEEAFKELAQLDGRLAEWSVLAAARGYAYGTAGRTAEARAVLAELDVLAQRRFVTSYGRALVYAGMNRREEAFAWLEKAFEERSHWLIWLRLDQRWSNLRGSPQFDALVERMRYPP